MLARDAWQAQVRMKAEAQRCCVRAERVHVDRDLQAAVGEARRVLQIVPKRKQLEQLRVVLVASQLRRERLGAAGAVVQLPLDATTDEPVDRETMIVERHSSLIAWDVDDVSLDGVVEPL